MDVLALRPSSGVAAGSSCRGPAQPRGSRAIRPVMCKSSQSDKIVISRRGALVGLAGLAAAAWVPSPAFAKGDAGDWSSPGLATPVDDNAPKFIKTDSGIKIQVHNGNACLHCGGPCAPALRQQEHTPSCSLSTGAGSGQRASASERGPCAHRLCPAQVGMLQCGRGWGEDGARIRCIGSAQVLPGYASGFLLQVLVCMCVQPYAYAAA